MRTIVKVIATSLILALVGGLGWTLTLHAADCSIQSVGFTPLNDLGLGTYQGFEGGLYPGGANTRPPAHQQAGLALAQAIQPLDNSGLPDSQAGAIVLLSIGMSNTRQEYQQFIDIAGPDPDKNPKVTLINGAQSGWSANKIVDPDASYWDNIDTLLSKKGLTPQQVQVVWLKQADARPTLPFPQNAQKLEDELKIIVQILNDRYPNLKLAYLTSRIYAGYATADLNPEPHAYEAGFAVKWLIEAQIEGDVDLNFDPLAGEVKAPWLSWGPYLWADGLQPRSDGLVWECQDFAPDGTHPSAQGAVKVANLLLDFFKADSTTGPWFLDAAVLPTPTQTPTSTPEPTATPTPVGAPLFDDNVYLPLILKVTP